jgi:hypothetical protein
LIRHIVSPKNVTGGIVNETKSIFGLIDTHEDYLCVDLAKTCGVRTGHPLHASFEKLLCLIGPIVQSQP